MKNKLLLNTSISVIYQVIVVVCGFILPRTILAAFGSEVNGLINSITQYLSVITFLELGVGASVSSSLYGPLGRKDWDSTSDIISSADKFFAKLARILMLYVVVLLFVYPLVSHKSFDYIFTASLILILSINSFSQYYLGIVDNIILGADQYAYITYGSQAIAHIINTVVCVSVINMGASIHLVKILTALIYFIRPLVVRIYISKHYPINRKKKITNSPIKQKWNAAAQHISECILDSTDIMILTVLSTFQNISVYSVYHLVVFNLKNVFLIATSSGFLPILGNLYSKNEKEQLNDFFFKVEWIIHSAVILVFGITAVLIVPFVSVYTSGFTDADYIQPVFAMLICIAHTSHALRLPYFMMVKAGAKYKETQFIFILTTLMNIVISIILVNYLGLPGVAIGTIVAMLTQTLYLAIYTYRKILNISLVNLIKRFLLDCLEFCLILLLGSFLIVNCHTYLDWVLLAIKVSIPSVVLVFVIKLIFERKIGKESILYLFNCKKSKTNS